MTATPPTTIRADDAPPTPSNKGKGKIAVDMDDVLCQTNFTIVDMHKELWGMQPPLTIDDFKYYLYWQNRGWSTPDQTVAMVQRLFREGLCKRAKPVAGSKQALEQLRSMGYRLIIITARGESERERTEDWIAEHMPDMFDEIHFTGAFAHLSATKEEQEGHVAKRAIVSHRKRSKAEVVHETGCLFLIDDSAENSLEASRGNPPCHVLLFGDYPWNRVVRKPEENTEEDTMTYIAAQERGMLDKVEARREALIKEGWLPPGVERISNWAEVVAWVKRAEENGQLGEKLN